MANFTARITLTYQLLAADQFAVLGRTVTYLPATLKVTAADRRHSEARIISGGLSAVSLLLPPLGNSAPGQLLFFLADQPVDVRFTSASDPVCLSAVRMLALGAQVSALYVTTGTPDTTIILEGCGGSAAQVTTSLPLS